MNRKSLVSIMNAPAPGKNWARARSLCVLLLLATAACVRPSRLHPFSLVTDPTDISVYGLTFAMPTENVARLTPLLDQTEATGGIGFDPSSRILFTANYQGVAMATNVVD